MRTFVAVPVDDPVRDAAARWMAHLARPGDGIKWVEPRNLHITLAFLGDLRPADVDRATEAVVRGSAGHRPFTLGFGGFGVFPHWRAPRVLWVGAREGAERLTALAQAVADALREAGFALDDRPYRPHLTLGRWRAPRRADDLQAAVAGQDSGLPPFRLERVDVMASRLTPQGPVYTVMAHVPLSGTAVPGNTWRGLA